MTSRQLLVVTLVLLTGCGPMLAPITVRLNPEQQQQVDGMWENVLTPLDRADHDLLLDVVREYWLFQLGVDTLHFRSEKRLAHGRVVMEADCERVSPDADQFLVTVYDEQGRTVFRQIAYFHPRGLLGQLYWWAVTPFHGVVPRLKPCEYRSSSDPPPGPRSPRRPSPWWPRGPPGSSCGRPR